jgi:predicted small metal-binding protein
VTGIDRTRRLRRQKEACMSKILECGVIVPGCKIVIHGDDEDDVVTKAVQHLHTVHNIEHVSEQLRARIRAAIKEPADKER